MYAYTEIWKRVSVSPEVSGEEDQGANGRREDKLEEAIMGCHMEMTCKQLICINNLTA